MAALSAGGEMRHGRRCKQRREVSRTARQQALSSGTFANGMEFLTWAAGPRTLLFIPGGPGSSLPTGMTARMSRRWFGPLIEAGYTVWVVTRRRNMPPGHTIADMADDYADVIDTEFDGRVDLVVGESYGGMIAQFLAAQHAESLGRAAIVVAAAEVSDWGKGVDRRLASAIAAGDTTGAGMAFAEYLVPGERGRWFRRLAGPWLGRSLLSGKNYPGADLLVETEAEISFDSRPVLPRIRVPVMLLCGDRDRFFPWDVIDETTRLIPGATLVRYERQGHMKAATNKRVSHDILAWVSR